MFGRTFLKEAGKKWDQQILVFSEGRAYLYTFKPVIEELIRRHIAFRYITMDKNDPALQIKSRYMSSRYLGQGALAFWKFSMSKAKIMLSTTPNIGTKGYPIIRPQRVECMAHIFHSISDVSFYRKGSLDFYDAVLMVGAFSLDSIRITEKLRALKTKECVSVGLPYFDVLASLANHNRNWSERPVLLIAPSWGRKGFLATYGNDFIIELAQSGFEIILRPHPQSLKSEKRVIENLEQRLKPYTHVHFDLDIDGSPSMSKSDVLISDSSSIRFDFAFIYERPVITLETPDECMEMYERSDVGVKWEASLEKQLGPIFTLNDKKELSQKLIAALANIRNLKPQNIAVLRDRYIANFGHSSKAIVDWISNKLSSPPF
ncbi:MAG: CDP-glycerol glycerophosphotransferase family protein [Holosporales bacterium]|jgi:hypothetical protein|nr:CDP-glycerol glycerophosphotransferase family protein [Holosporales bacterium]